MNCKSKQISKLNNLNHLAIILDGNGRWAQKRGLPRSIGHFYGGLNIGNVVKALSNFHDVKMLSLFIFSRDNFKRPMEEVEYIFSKPVEYLKNDKIQNIIKSNVIIKHIGYLDHVPPAFKNLLHSLIQETQNNTGLILNLCINYSSKKEIQNHCEKGWLLDTNVDLLIRTGNRKRLSDFLLYQSAYAEIYFSKKMWPSFNKFDLTKAIRFYYKQKRTFGEIK